MRCFSLGLAFFAAAAVVLAGCQRSSQGTQQTIDSLRAENSALSNELASLRDSLGGGSSSGPRGRTLEPVVYFPSGSAWLTDRGREALDEIAAKLKGEYANYEFRIQGYTDSVPIGPSLDETYPSNWYLSAQRSAAVAHYLDTEHQVQTQTLEVGAYGEQNPVAPNETAEGRQRNRRVEIVIGDRKPDPGP